MDTCDNAVKKSLFMFDNILLHVLILFVILSVLFIKVISPLTKKGFNTEFNHLVDEIMNAKNLSNMDKDKKLKNVLSSMSDTVYTGIINNMQSHPNRLSEEKNDALNKFIILIGIGLLACVLIVSILPGKYFKCPVDLKTLGIELLVIFSMVGVIEFWFFNNVASKYIPVNPSFLTEYINQKLSSYI